MSRGYTEKELRIAAKNMRMQYGVIDLLMAECRKIQFDSRVVIDKTIKAPDGFITVDEQTIINEA